jgi:hypothetical protein
MHTDEAYSTRLRHRLVAVAVFNSLMILATVPTLVESKPIVNMQTPGKFQNNDYISNYLISRNIRLRISI